ncbi:MAG: hypothetical protein ACTHJ5_08730 [Ilyomonas sp.]
MNYFRDSILKGDSWNDEGVIPYLYSACYRCIEKGSPDYRKDTYDSTFTKAELKFIYNRLSDTTTFYLSPEMKKQAIKVTADSIGKYFRDMYSLENLLDKIYGVEDIKSGDSLHVDTARFNRLNTEYKIQLLNRVKEYNKDIHAINNYKQRQKKLSLFTGSKPIFVRGYTYCVFLYYYDQLYIDLFKKMNGHWQFVKTLFSKPLSYD